MPELPKSNNLDSKETIEQSNSISPGLQKFLHKLLHQKHNKTKKSLYPKVIICNQEEKNGISQNSQEINALGRILPAFENDWQGMDNEVDSMTVKRWIYLKERAMKSAFEIFDAYFLPSYEVTKGKKSKRIQTIKNKIAQLNKMNHKSLIQLINDLDRDFKTYNDSHILNALYLTSLYISFKRYMCIEKSYGDHALYGKNKPNTEKDIAHTIHDVDKSSLNEIDFNDNKEKNPLHEHLLHTLLHIGEESNQEKLFKKLLLHSKWTGRVKTLTSDIIKAHKKYENIEKIKERGTTGDTVGIRCRVYNESAVKMDLIGFKETIENFPGIFVETKHKGMLDEYSDSNIDSSKNISKFINFKIYKTDNQGNILYSIGEIQFLPHDKIIYERALKEIHDNHGLKITNIKKKEITEIKPKNVYDFTGYLLNRVNDLQHLIYKIPEQRGLKHLYVPDAILYTKNSHQRTFALEGLIEFIHFVKKEYINKVRKDLNSEEFITSISKKNNFQNIEYTPKFSGISSHDYQEEDAIRANIQTNVSKRKINKFEKLIKEQTNNIKEEIRGDIAIEHVVETDEMRNKAILLVQKFLKTLEESGQDYFAAENKLLSLLAEFKIYLQNKKQAVPLSKNLNAGKRKKS